MLKDNVTRILVKISIFICSGVCAGEIRTNALYHAFNTYPQDTASFLASVLPVISRSELTHNTSSHIYKAIRTDIEDMGTARYAYRIITMLQQQRAILAEQTKRLLDHIGKTEIHGYAEIGTPGTYIRSIHKHTPITSPVYVAGDRPDRMLSFSPHPTQGFQAYDTFIACGDFHPIQSDEIPDQSVELVTCYPGLHHIPSDHLDAFVASIARILKPGGVLVLREHDIVDETITTMAHTAHELFNACVARMSQQESDAEYRNFQPVEFWKALLKKHNLMPYDDMLLLQDGDPTANTLFACVKQPETIDESAQVMHAQQSGEETQAVDTFLSTPEWYNVDVSQAYGAYIEHTPFYEFPYMQSLSTYWKLLFKSIGAAYQRGGMSAVLSSPYFVVDTFIGAFMTVEYGTKAVVSWPISKLYGVYMTPEPLNLSVRGSIPEFIQSTYQVTPVTTDQTFGVSIYKMPIRYQTCVRFMQELAHNSDAQIIRINGHDAIQCKVRAKCDADITSIQLDGVDILYDWALPTQEQYRYYAVAVPASQLLACIRAVHAQNMDIAYIHDF